MSVVLIIITGDSLVLGDARRDPLTRTEVLALVAGGVFSKIVVHAIELHGLALTVDDNFISLATATGAHVKVIAALAKAKGASSPGDSLSEHPPDQNLGHHEASRGLGGLNRRGTIQFSGGAVVIARMD